MAGSAFTARELAAFGVVRPEAVPFLTAFGLVGGLVLVSGLSYALVRQLRRRRLLSTERYRGPSVVLQLALGIVLATAATVPFADDINTLILGTGELTLLGAIVIITSTQAALVAVTWLFVLRFRAIEYAMPLLGSGRLRALGAGLGWGVLAWIVASALTLLMVVLLQQIGIAAETAPAEQALGLLEPWIVVPAIVVLAPVAEELFFRGVAFNAWLRERGLRFAYIGSSALFAAIHLSLVSLLPIFVLGLAFAWVYRRTGSLIAPIAMHATVNGISVALALLIRYEVIRIPT